MNKAILFFLGVGLPLYINAQTVEKLTQKFKSENNQYQVKFNKITSQNNLSQGSSESLEKEKRNLAGFAGGIPVFLEPDDTRANRSANLESIQNGTLQGLNNTPIDGTGINILVMDGGRIFEKHREFGADASGNVSVQRIYDKENGAVAYSSHSTNVGGIIGAIGYTSFGSPYGANAARGVLTNVSMDSYTFSTTSAGNNYVKLANATTANVSNHSYGINLGWYYASSTSTTYPNVGWYWIGNYDLNTQDTYSGSYNTQDSNFDAIIYNNPNQIVIKSAGNYYGMGPTTIDNAYKWSSSQNKYVPFEATDTLPPVNCSEGYYCIGWGSLAKNVIVVGATNQLTTTNNIYTSSSDVVKASYSSAGPRRDGAIKPDLSAVGSNDLVANYTSSTVYNAYATGSGTSYAAPIVSGIAGAVTQINRNITGNATFTYKADEMKALLTHTANEAGNPGPDVWYGWGFVDATKAANVVIDKNSNNAIFERKTLTSGNTYSVDVVGKSDSPLKATISWVDPPSTPFTTDDDLQNNHSSKLLNDLDLRIIDTTDNTIYYPWKLDISNPMANATKGDNIVDNVEQILIDSPISGRIYRIEVSNKGTLVNNSSDYALVVTGYNTDSLSSTESITKSIAVYPTKTKDNVYIIIPSGGKFISVIDMSGKQILSNPAKPYQVIDFSGVPKGIYLINIITNSGIVTKKVIKE